MILRSPLKTALKRGALLAAANWPVTIVQAGADLLFKLVVAAPLVGGIVLVAMLVGAEPRVLLSLEWRDLAATMLGALQSHPLMLTAFVVSLATVVVGGSLFVFLIKGGTVAILVRAERDAPPIETSPLQLSTMAAAARFSIDAFVEAARSLFPRYARLGLALMALYLVSGAVYVLLLFALRRAGAGWGATTLATVGFVAEITLINLVYLLIQIVLAAEGCGVVAAAGRVAAFLRRDGPTVGLVCAAVLGLVVLTTGASVLATAALGLIAFVPFPFLGLAVMPLQLLAWVLRELLFQFIGIGSIGSYCTLYRRSCGQTGAARSVPPHSASDALRPAS